MNRKEIALMYHDKDWERGAPAPCFVPDFSFDNSLYQQIGGLNEISVAMSNHHLKDVCQVRLQEVPSTSVLVNDDGLIFDNIAPKSMDVSELLDYAHDMERLVLNENNSD